jgi:molybdate transport system substrate-binding protein
MAWRRDRLFSVLCLLLAALVVVPEIAALSGQEHAARADSTRIAVAANFADAAQDIAQAFAAESGHHAELSTGSTGLLYTQIRQGAPFDAFLAADQARPDRAVREGLALPGSRFTYATGRLALYTRRNGVQLGPDTLRTGRFDRLAIANPATAPYGIAATEVMQNLGVDELLAGRIVRGTSIAQAYQFVFTGNAEFGFVAWSQVKHLTAGSRWLVPAALHHPIAQDAVLLTGGADNVAAAQFLTFLKGPAAARIMADYGYGTDTGTGTEPDNRHDD